MNRHARLRLASRLALLGALSTPLAFAEPLPVRDQSPLLSGIGLPPPYSAELPDTWSLAFDFSWGSVASILESDELRLIADAETREWRLTAARSINERIALRMRVPYRETSGGSLDGFIDDWHGFFSLPEGERPLLPEDELRLSLERGGAEELRIDTPRSGLGDVAFDVGYQLNASMQSAVSAWLTIELPSGDPEKLTGNGAIDASLAIAAQRKVGDQLTLFGQAAFTWLGDDDWLGLEQEQSVWSAVAGATWRPTSRMEFTAQLDAHSSAFKDDELDLLGDSLALTVGGAVRLNDAWRLQLGVTEDIAVETTSDVVFLFGVEYATAR